MVKVSVIIPVYNNEKFLKKCLISVLNQTYSNLEIILIDDGSTDQSLKICNDISEEDSRVIVLSKHNEGQGIARNYGLTFCTGNFVTFVDADDYLDSYCIEKLMSFMIEYNVDFVVGGYKKVSSSKVLYEETYPNKKNLNPKKDISSRMLGDLPNTDDSIKSTVWNSLYKRKIIIDNKITFSSERKVFSEDTVFNLDYMEFCTNAFICDSIGYNYRLNFDSTSKKYDANKMRLINEYLDYIADRFESNNSALLRAQRTYLVNYKRCIIQEKNNPDVYSIFGLNKRIKYIINNFKARFVLKNYPICALHKKDQVVFSLCRMKLSFILSILVYYSIGRKKDFSN